ncbi:hypothetical protein D1818_01715 [Aquimarina sp. BL5]|uniref:hypothetical protein n=1 Tax=Aquimarina sp. BL5 TaxID=1714860 RepID=UPI000E4FDA1E|nr:hypothetical protein [Aquimarina sp. BL5]AXT49596.1 hypothetical protein D1818_01715 [Aquimarina sp. BL5]RKM98405.1 hypothetical protein D7036_20170 [Aquimarina sp. BL5]
MSTNGISTAGGKLFFSNPPHPDSSHTPEFKELHDIKDFKIETPAKSKSLAKSSLPKVAVYAVAPDVVVTAANPLVISGSGPVSVGFGKVTIEPGGQIRVLTTADIRIDELIKK